MKTLLRLGFLMVLLSAVPIHAQESPAAEQETEAESPVRTVWKWVNFAVLFGGLGYLLKKPAKEFFDSRKADIASGLERAQKAQEEAAQRMSQIEQRLGKLSTEIAGLRTQSEQDAAREKEKIVSEAQRDVDRVVEQSRQEMERIAQGIEREIKESIADVVIERASQRLQTKMTPDDQKKVVVRFIKNL